MNRLLAIVGLLLLSALASAQQTETQPVQRRKALLEGTHVFRRILFDQGLEPLNAFAALAEDQRRTVLVVLGEGNALARVPGGVDRFVRSGGALLLASDRAITDARARSQIIGIAGVSISGDKLLCRIDGAATYRGLEFSPRIDLTKGARSNIWPGAIDISVLPYANLPSHLIKREVLSQGRVSPIAHLPPNCVYDAPGNLLEMHPGPALFGVAGQVGRGRVVVLADHSVFINEMMLPTDTGNVEFSDALVRWLREPDGQRDRVLFVDESGIQTKFDIPLKSIDIPPEEALQLLFSQRNALTRKAQDVVGNLQHQGFANRKMAELLERLGGRERLLPVLVTAATLVVLLYAVYRLGMRTRFRHDTSVPVLAQALAQNLPHAPLAEQRRQSLLRIGDLREPAARLVRRWFARLGVEAGEQPPAFAVQGGWWQRFRLLSRLRSLWKLATARQPSRKGVAELWRLQRELDELQADWERGVWSMGKGGG